MNSIPSTPFQFHSQLRLKLSRAIALSRKRLPISLRVTRTVILAVTFLIFILIIIFGISTNRSSSISNTSSNTFDLSIARQSASKWTPPPSSPYAEHEIWNKIKHDVVIGIKTGHEVAKDRLFDLKHHGWWSVGRHVPNLVIIGDEADEELGVISIKEYAKHLLLQQQSQHVNNTSEFAFPSHWFEKSGWKGDKDKNLPAFHLMRKLHPDKKWYLLLDDDTYIFLENFAKYTLQQDVNDKPVYTGKVFYISKCGGFARDGSWIADNAQPKGTFAHGGSGIVLNQKAMDVLYPRVKDCIREFSSCWAGDIQVALCLRTGGITTRRHGPKRSYEKHFIPFWPSKALSDKRYSARWKSTEEPITFHKIPVGEQKLMSELERLTMKSGETIVYAELKDHLLRNGIIPCNDEHNRKNKYFSTEFFPKGWKW